MNSEEPTLKVFRPARRGFTLLELFATISLVAILSALAVPSVLLLVDKQQQAEAVQQIASVVRDARGLALGRGGVVLVRYPDGNGDVAVREAIEGTRAGGGCTTGPALGCARAGQWDSDTFSRLIDTVSLPSGTAVASDGTSVTSLDLCFTPQGRTFANLNGAGFAHLTREISFSQTDNGFVRRVAVLPHGGTRYIVTEEEVTP